MLALKSCASIAMLALKLFLFPLRCSLFRAYWGFLYLYNTWWGLFCLGNSMLKRCIFGCLYCSFTVVISSVKISDNTTFRSISLFWGFSIVWASWITTLVQEGGQHSEKISSHRFCTQGQHPWAFAHRLSHLSFSHYLIRDISSLHLTWQTKPKQWNLPLK